MLVIGLTGGIGTGKTEVAGILEELGATVINADLLGHEAYRPHTDGWRDVVAAFGEGVLGSSGEVDRRKLGSIVFGDPEALRLLNAIVHPLIYGMTEERIQALRATGSRVVVVEAALLVEANWVSLVDEVWVTTSPEERAVQRIVSRNNLDEGAVRARIGSQMAQEERVHYADAVIDNSGTLEDLRGRVKELWNSRALAHEEQQR